LAEHLRQHLSINEHPTGALNMQEPAQAAADYRWRDAAATDTHSYVEPVVLKTLRELPVAPERAGRPLRVFDAGCGNGTLLKSLRQAGHQVAGCDASESGVAIAQQSLGGGIQIELRSVYDDLASTFGTDWDVVVATEVVEHLYAPRTFVARAREMLAPGGHVLLTTPYHGYVKNLVIALLGGCDEHYTALWDGGHIKFWSYATLTTLLREQGFEDFRFAGAGRLPLLWKSMVVSARLKR
jgi:2-polyprenyl-6-hydroxyphenyl methylase/3-demethylubiquinone-9 3-methyltransferase